MDGGAPSGLPQRIHAKGGCVGLSLGETARVLRPRAHSPERRATRTGSRRAVTQLIEHALGDDRALPGSKSKSSSLRSPSWPPPRIRRTRLRPVPRRIIRRPASGGAIQPRAAGAPREKRQRRQQGDQATAQRPGGRTSSAAADGQPSPSPRWVSMTEAPSLRRRWWMCTSIALLSIDSSQP